MKLNLIRKSDKKILSTATVDESMGMASLKFTLSKKILDEIKPGDALFVARARED